MLYEYNISPESKKEIVNFHAAGSDLMLIKLVEQALKKADWPTQVACGRYEFPLNGGTTIEARG